MSRTEKTVFLTKEPRVVVSYTITFAVTPADATIKYKLNGSEEQTLVGTTLTANSGDFLDYEFSKTGYQTYNNNLTVSKNETITYTMEEEIDPNYIYDTEGTSHADTEIVDDGSYTFNSTTSKNKNVTGALNFTKLTTISTNNFLYMSINSNTKITSVNFKKLTSIGENGLNSAFRNDSKITSISFPELTTIGDYGMRETFYFASGITSVSFPKLTTISRYGMLNTFYGCNKITSVSFPELTTITTVGTEATMENCFYGANITGELRFPKLESISDYCFNNTFRANTNITKVYFDSLTTIGTEGLRDIFNGCTGITEVHFKASMASHTQCTKEKMGCSNATIYFDL